MIMKKELISEIGILTRKAKVVYLMKRYTFHAMSQARLISSLCCHAFWFFFLSVMLRKHILVRNVKIGKINLPPWL